jgi:acetyl-CoA hydrolase
VDIDLGRHVRAGDTVVWGQGSAEPTTVVAELLAQRHTIGPFTCFLGVSLGDTARSEHADVVRFVSYCGSGSNCALIASGALDVLPCAYSEIPRWLSSGRLRADVVLLHLPPAGADGLHGMGLAEEYLPAAIDAARVVIAEVNDQLPDVPSRRRLRPDELDVVVHTSRPPLGVVSEPPSEIARRIGAQVAGLVDDGATLQVGLGALVDGVVTALRDRRDLGVHSGVVGDGIAELIESGAVTNRRKEVDGGVSVAGMLLGSERLWKVADRSLALALRPTTYTHAPAVLARLGRFVALNAAIEIDLTGQINAEVAGGRYVGAVGGAAEFLRAAARSPHGLPIVLAPASRIVEVLSGPVSTARVDAGIVVTEHGVADLRGCTLRERREQLLEVASER